MTIVRMLTHWKRFIMVTFICSMAQSGKQPLKVGLVRNQARLPVSLSDAPFVDVESADAAGGFSKRWSVSYK